MQRKASYDNELSQQTTAYVRSNIWIHWNSVNLCRASTFFSFHSIKFKCIKTIKTAVILAYLKQFLPFGVDSSKLVPDLLCYFWTASGREEITRFIQLCVSVLPLSQILWIYGRTKENSPLLTHYSPMDIISKVLIQKILSYT